MLHATPKIFLRPNKSVSRVYKTQLSKINWKIKSIFYGLATRTLYFLKKYDTKQPFSPSCRNWPICVHYAQPTAHRAFVQFDMAACCLGQKIVGWISGCRSILPCALLKPPLVNLHYILQSAQCANIKVQFAQCIVFTFYYEVCNCTPPWRTLPLATATNFLGKERACAQKPVRLNL